MGWKLKKKCKKLVKFGDVNAKTNRANNSKKTGEINIKHQINIEVMNICFLL